jgi:hypothetical protein
MESVVTKTSTNVPPLRQSIVETMACPHSYGLIHIEGIKPPDTAASIRGTEVHRVLAQYVWHCALKRIPADFTFLDTLTMNVADETAQILEMCRDNFTVDFDNLFACEMSMGLDESFLPTYSLDHDGNAVPQDPIWGIPQNTKAPAYCAILDAIYVFRGGKLAKVKDYKSHPRPFDPDTVQAKLYSLMLFQHMPELEEIEFVLQFVRYKNVYKPITFRREDIPELMIEVARARQRQFEMHLYYSRESLAAIPGPQCTYCPALSDFSCPIAKLNPMMQLTPEERLSFRLWYDVANRANNKAMKDYVDGSGKEIRAQDNNGNHYSFGPVRKDKVTYPLFVLDAAGGFETPIVNQLSTWSFDEPDDMVPTRRGGKPWLTNLRISSTELKRYLKASKRETIDNAIKDLAVVEPVTELRISRDAQVDDGQGEEHRDFDPETMREGNQ